MPDLSIPNHFLHAVLENAPSQGKDCQKLLNRANITQKIFQEPHARVTVEQYTNLQAFTMRELNDEMLGYLDRPLKLGTWSALCHWLIHARTLSQALKRYCLFFSLLENGIKIELHTKANNLTIAFSPWQSDKQLKPYAYELFMFNLHRLSCWLTQHNLPIKHARFSYPRPAHSQEYRALFPGAQYSFDNEQCTLELDRKLLEKTVKQNPENLAQFLKKPLLNIIINEYNQKSWVARTRNILQNDLIQLPNLVDVANKLDIHPKKLRRRLLDEGIAYSELKSQLRRDVAIRHLTKTNHTIERIALLTGFSETSTFTRAFKRWTGVTPFTYRKNPQ
ncbi:MAG: AraC family transcriptional regulator [Spongiibacteraceae bacterium]|nr:AraC family transcriptional regulator [Spongiibacteraceae bacterium]